MPIGLKKRYTKQNYHNIVCNISNKFEIKFINNFDDVPIPNRDIYYQKYSFMKNFTMRRFLFSSGCPNKCTYCYNEVFRKRFKGIYPRKVILRNPEKAIEEMKMVLDKYPAKVVGFVDDNFCINRNWLERFLFLYNKHIHKPYKISASPNVLNDDIINILSKSNLRLAVIAMETTNEDIRNNILLRPHYSNDRLKTIIRRFHGSNIQIVMNNMFAVPTQTLDDCIDAVKFARKNRVNLQADLLIPYEGTAINDYCKKNNMLTDPDVKMGGCYSSDPIIKGKEAERMTCLQNYVFFINYFYFLLHVIKFLSRYKWFCFLSARIVAPINAIGLNFTHYAGLLPLHQILIQGIRFKTTIWRKK